MKPVKPKLANLIAAVDRQIDGMTTYMYNLCDVFITYVQCIHTYVCASRYFQHFQYRRAEFAAFLVAGDCLEKSVCTRC